MEDLVALSDAGYHAFDRAVVVRAGGAVEEIDGLLFTSTPTHQAPFIVNGMFRLDRGVSAEETILRGRAYYGNRGLVAGISTHGDEADLDAALAASGFEMLVELGGMVALGPIDRVAPGSGVTLQVVNSLDHLRDLVQVLGESFGPEEPWPSLWKSVFADLSTLDPINTSAVIAVIDGEPAAAAVAYALDPVGVVGMVGTPSRFGRRGLGELVTRRVAGDVRDMTGRPVALQSSPIAQSLYERIGFRRVTTYRLWVDRRE